MEKAEAKELKQKAKQEKEAIEKKVQQESEERLNKVYSLLTDDIKAQIQDTVLKQLEQNNGFNYQRYTKLKEESKPVDEDRSVAPYLLVLRNEILEKYYVNNNSMD